MSEPVINYELLIRSLLLDAKRFADGAATIAFEIRKDIQDQDDIYEQEQFASRRFKRIVIALQELHIINGMCDLLGLSLHKEKIITLCAERLLGPNLIPQVPLPNSNTRQD